VNRITSTLTIAQKQVDYQKRLMKAVNKLRTSPLLTPTSTNYF